MPLHSLGLSPIICLSLLDIACPMAENQQVCFVSDIHIRHDHCPQATMFDKFCQQLSPQCTTLYLLGDIFDTWLGPEDETKFKQVLTQLQHLTTTMHVAFMPGNHDFLLDEALCHRYGMAYLPDPFMLTLGEKRILLSHGDLLCQRDKRYQRYRKVVRHALTQRCYGLLPYRARNRIAGLLQDSSSQHNTLCARTDIDDKAAINWFRHYHADIMIHGHTHKPGKHHYQFQRQRLVLGAWHQEPSALYASAEEGP